MIDDPQQLSANKQALLKIRALKQQLADALASSESVGNVPIAIVSMACRFPRRASTPERFWQCLMDRTDEVGEIPADRWDLDAFHDDDPEVPGKMYARRGVFLDHLDLMDPEFFGISPREATWVDPQQRLLLEVGWEALERAAWTPKKIGPQTGVFIGWMHNDYQNEASDSFLNLNPYIATGAAGSFLSGRLAYYLGLQGPSVAVDTACSSSLVALHLAIQSLQRRDCDRALVGGVNAIASPTTNILTCKLKALSPTGQSRAFDAGADGYLRGEGCGVITLRRLADARAEGDPIIGIVRGSAVGHNGFSSGLTAPNPKAQEQVIRQALQRAGIAPNDVAYLEAHGTGTELGDPIEMQAAAAALATDRSFENPLLVGSVKTNIGHLEAAAGMAGLIKVLLAFEHHQIPGQLNFETPNPHIPWSKIPVRILTEPTNWPSSERRVAGVSAFGMSGTNAHVIVEAATSTADSQVQPQNQRSQLIVLSATNDQALQTLADDYAACIARNDSLDLADIAYTSTVGRSHFEHRIAMVAANRNEAIEKLKTLARGSELPFVFSGVGRRTPKIAWQFTGQGSQYVGMARELYDSQPVFRDVVDHCDRLLQSWRNDSLISVMFADEARLNDTHWTQPAIFAVQMGLAQMLQSFGLSPDVVWGHSVGQYAAACVAGIMSWDDGLKLISERGRLIGQLPVGGQMLAVFASLEIVQAELAGFAELSLAAHNGAHIVISGEADSIAVIQQRFAEQNFRTKRLTTSHAFHSLLMESALRPFADFANTIRFQPPHTPIVCNLTGRLLPADTILDGDYWAAHIREAVQFSPTIATAEEVGCQLILELGPQAILTSMAAANWGRPTGSLVSCLQKNVNDHDSVLSAIAQLYVQGCTPDFEAMHAGHTNRSVMLPTYPFQRRRFWGPDKPRAFHAAYHTAHPLLGSPVSLAGNTDERRFESFIDVDSPAWLGDHQVINGSVLPGAAFIEMAIAAAGSDQIEDIVFEQPLRPQARTALQTVIRKSTEQHTIETYSSPAVSQQWTRNFRAKLVSADHDRPPSIDRSKWEQALPASASPDEFYRRLQQLGLNYGPAFQTIRSLQFSPTEVLAHLQSNADIRGYRIPPTLLDGAFHSLAVGLLQEDDGNLFLPTGIGRVRCWQAIENEVWCHAVWRQNEGKIRTADLVLFHADGSVALEIESLKVEQVSLAALRQMSGSGAERLIYDLNWERTRLPVTRTNNKTWLVIAERLDSLATRLSEQLQAAKNQPIEVRLQTGQMFQRVTATQFTFCGAVNENWQRLFSELSTEQTPFQPQGISWLIGEAAAKNAVEGILNLVATLTQREQRQIECGWQVITTAAITAGENQTLAIQQVRPEQSQFWGLGRVLGAEQPDFRCRLIDLPIDNRQSEETVSAITEILLTETLDNQFAIRESHLYVPRMNRVAASKSKTDFAIRSTGCYLITGGLGMLGQNAAKWLAAKGAKQILLVSRRAPNDATQKFLAELMLEFECEIVVHLANLADVNEMQTLFSRFERPSTDESNHPPTADLAPLAGVIHAAGVLDDGLLTAQNWERFEKVLAPKVIGASLLHDLTRSLDLDFFILYSSVASVLGSRGQSNYAMANAFLDGLAWQRRGLGLPATSINWGPWTAGMADDERLVKRLALQGITPLPIDEAHSAMEQILATDRVQATVIDVDWRRMQTGLGAQSPAMLQGLAPLKQKSQIGDSELVRQLKNLRGMPQRELLLATVQQLLQRILSTPEAPPTDRPLIEMGLDSLMAVEFGTELQQRLGDQFAVGPTMLFDHPTIDAITDHVLALVANSNADSDAGKMPDEVAVGATVAITPTPIPLREDVAIIGMSCRFPGARNIDQFWQNLLNRVDSVCDIPPDRWDVDRFFSAEREPGKMYTRAGGFLDDIADFDAAFFNIAEQEACWIDPQHRLLLENSYHALEDAGISPYPLADANVGVFMGIMGQDYAFIPSLDDVDVIDGFQGAGLSHSAGVGRISYVFGFEGPSVAVDTASSSSLVALLQAVRSLQEGDCNLALAGGVNAILVPVNSLLMSKAGLLSPDGRCKSFSAQADGFGRGEGCGVVVLKRLSDAQRDGDRIMAVVRGGAVVHNGFSSGITAPSGKSQSRVIRAALHDAQIAPTQVQYLEAHGTGTEYGDPLELGAAAQVYGKGRQRDQPLLVGSVKGNISHLEAAGGISGVIKTVLALHHRIIPPQANFDAPSPHIPWQRLPVKMVTETTPWPETSITSTTDLRIAGVTALGLVGTNAHVILSSAPVAASQVIEPKMKPSMTDDDSSIAKPSELLVLSARNDQALTQLASELKTFLVKQPQTNLGELCQTTSAGRRHFEHRAAITLPSIDEAIKKLSELAQIGASSRNGQTNCLLSNEPAQTGIQTPDDHANHPANYWMRNVCCATPKIGWLFDGDLNFKNFDIKLARELYAVEPIFRKLMDEFDAVLTNDSEQNGQTKVLLGELLANEKISFEATEVHQFALQAGLAKLWQSWGVHPDVLLGVGVGQFTAACIAGSLTFDDALLLVRRRADVLTALGCNSFIENVQAIDESTLDETTRNSLDDFETFADTLNYYPPNLTLICSVEGAEMPVHRSLGGSFWRRHCVAPALLLESANVLAKMNCDYILDLSPVENADPTIRQFVSATSAKWLRGLNSNQSATTSLQTALGQLYVGGLNPDFATFGQSRKRISLPPYPFQKKRYWITEISQFADGNRKQHPSETIQG